MQRDQGRREPITTVILAHEVDRVLTPVAISTRGGWIDNVLKKHPLTVGGRVSNADRERENAFK